jgi:hypothetical protein
MILGTVYIFRTSEEARSNGVNRPAFRQGLLDSSRLLSMSRSARSNEADAKRCFQSFCKVRIGKYLFYIPIYLPVWEEFVCLPQFNRPGTSPSALRPEQIPGAGRTCLAGRA